MAISLEIKRIVVLVISAALLIISAVDLFYGYNYLFTIIVDICVIIGAVGGLIGAWRLDQRHLGWFFWTLALLIVLQVAFILYHFLHHDDHETAIGYTRFNFVTLAILILGIICTYDLRRALGVDSLHTSAPLLGNAAIV